MQKIIVVFLFGFLFVATPSIAQTDTIPADFCISKEEFQLYELINEYRKSFALPPISLSKSLSYVAIAHARDLASFYNPDSVCNMHSWSNKGRWTPICFPSQQSRKNNVRLKAIEIIGYPAEAYEITYWSNVEKMPRQILSFWREKKVSADMLLNRNEWKSSAWKAIGVGIEEGYAVVWLGKVVDYEVSTPVCGSQIKVLNDAAPDYKLAQATQVKNPNQSIYYITIASFNDRKDAINAVKSYKEMGYPKTVLLEVENKIRVAVDYYTDKSEADNALKKYAQKFKGAWILTI